MANKLELMWLGKENSVSVEPRILIERKDLSYSNTVSSLFDDNTYDNLLIHGDNLLALKALENRFAGKIKCVFIDPPYNTGSAFDFYDDNVEHSTWLNLMRPRLELLYNLLADGGVIFIQIDDNEQAYLKVLCDELFGRKNFVDCICVKMSDPSGPKMAHADKRLPKLKEYILMYKKGDISLNRVTIRKEKWDSEYKNFLDVTKDEMEHMLLADESEFDSINSVISDKLITLQEAFAKYRIKKSDETSFCFDNEWRIARTSNAASILKFVLDNSITSKIQLVKYKDTNMFVKGDFDRDSKTPRVQYVFADGTNEVPVCDLWTDINTSFNAEGGIVFKNGQKPERLVERCIELITKPGDWVLDSFLGSGSTAATAQKMKRRWIGIELGDHAYSLCKKRMDNVISGSDKSGISQRQNYEGGGGYKFYELAPTLINIDAFGQPVINKEYNSDMLAAAVAIHEGFKYDPDKDCYWKQAKNENNTYLYVTTNHVNENIINSIKADMKDDEFLVLVCKSFDETMKHASKNITIKKIPQSLLKNCEFGVDNYNLNIVCPPEYEYEEDK